MLPPNCRKSYRQFLREYLVECKLGSAEIDDGAGHLKELVGLIRKHNEEEKQVPLRENHSKLSKC